MLTQNGRLPVNWPLTMKTIFRWLYIFQTTFQEEAWSLLPIITSVSLPTTQKHFDWAVQVLLGYKKHPQVDYDKADFVQKCFGLSTSLPS